LLQGDHARMAVVVSIPVLERDVLRRHLDESSAGLDQAAREEAAEAEAARIVARVGFLRLPRQVERLRRRRAQQPVGVVHGADQALLLVIAAGAADRTAGDQLLIELLAVGEPRRAHPAGRADGLHRLVGEWEDEWPILAAQEARGVERLQLLALAPLGPLPAIPECRHRL